MVLLATLSFNVFADQNLDTSGLSRDEISALAAQAKEMKDKKESPSNVSSTVRKEAEAWGELGANMGKAIVGGAKEVGVAANDFATTPLGKVTVGVVVYKLIGKDIIGVIIGCIILFVGTAFGYKLFKSNSYPSKFEYQPRLWGLYHKKVALAHSEYSHDRSTFHGFVGMVIMAVSAAAGLTCIFK